MTLNRYQKTATATIIITIILITIGGLVRVSGAGLGCPDWPRCFGRWIPPLSSAQLPAGYNKELFNPVLTWTEYINRLFGVLTGFMILLTAVFSIPYRKNQTSVFISSLAALVLVIFQGWLGGVVVESSLTGWIVTTHLMVALGILALLIFAILKASSRNITAELMDGSSRLLIVWTGIGLLIVTLVQVGLGAGVRSVMDTLRNRIPRSEWLAHTGSLNDYHQGFAWVVFMVGMYLLYHFKDYPAKSLLKRTATSIIAMLFFQMIVGMALVFYQVPPALQILHLTNAALLFCLEFFFVIVAFGAKKKPAEKQPA